MRFMHKKITIMLLIFICGIALFPGNVYADVTVPGEEAPASYAENKSPSSWLYNQDQSGIYGSAGEMDLSADDAEDEEQGIFEKLLMGPVNGFAHAINSILEKGHITLDSIIMGRVDGHGIAVKSKVLGNHIVALFTFELAKGNIFGIISANVYAILRSVIYIIIVCVVFAKVVAAGWQGDGARAMFAFKSAFGEMMIAFLMLQLMPYLLDLIFYLRDIMLHLLYSGLGRSTGLDISGVSGLAGVFEKLSTKNLLNTFMYLGSVVITVWFMLQYIGLALSFCIYFFSFPFVCVNSLYARNELIEWWKSVIGYAIVPIGDVVLLFIPAAFGLLGNSFIISAIQFCICAMLIPARSVLRAVMGIRSNFAMELAAMGALGGAARFAGGVARTFGKTVTGVAGGVADLRAAQMFEKAADEGVDLTGGSLDNGGAFGDPYGGFRGGNSSAAQEILGSRATTANFEEPVFRGLSNEKKAELYKKRGVQKLAGAAFGGMAGVTGAGMGAGMGMFMGADSAGQFAGALASGGTEAAQAGVGYGVGAYRELRALGNTAYQKGGELKDNVTQWGNDLKDGVSQLRYENNWRNQHLTPGNNPQFKQAHQLVNSVPQTMEQFFSDSDMQELSTSLEALQMPVPLPEKMDGVGENVSIPYENANMCLQKGFGFENATFEEYVGNQYDDIMSDKNFGTRQERANELRERVAQYTENGYANWLTASYPGLPKEIAENQQHAARNYANARFVFNDRRNTWNELSQNGKQKREFTFE